MSYLINNELIWIMTPKCASYSVENSLKKSNLKIESYNPPSTIFNVGHHIHHTLNSSITRFGKKETICITRDWFSKWLSALDFIFTQIEFHTNYEPIIKWQDIDNDCIYRLFDDKFINDLHTILDKNINNCFIKLLKPNYLLSNIITDNDFIDKKNSVSMLISNKYWLSNQRCTYEFDIKELDKFVDLIEKKFGEKLIINFDNVSSHRPNKIIKNDELRNWVWDKFEKRFEKSNNLI
jgi:hypothetical protein